MSETPVAIITGATGGIGLALTSELADLGYRTVVHGFKGPRDAADVAEQFPNAVAIEADLSTAQGAELVKDIAMGAFGRIDVVVNNAGIGVPVPHHDLDAITQEFFEKMLGINLVGPWLVTRACANELRRSSGCIVNISSIAGSTVGGSSIPYAVSKAGLDHMTRLLAAAMGPEVRVNAIAPGFVETERTSSWSTLRANVDANSPLRRTGVPAEVAKACVALIEAKYTTGEILRVDGGLGLL